MQMIEIQRQQCLEEAQLENETAGESGASEEERAGRGVPGSLLSRAPSKACGSHNSRQMRTKDTGHTPELWASDTAEGPQGHHTFLTPSISGEFPALIP